jgi:hypothetical protein
MMIVSVCIRIPYFIADHPNNYNWMHAATLRSVDIFNQTGSMRDFFAPAMTYPGEGNLHIDNNSTNEPGRNGFVTEDGRYYYLSYPPFAFMVLSFFFGILPFGLNITSISVAAIGIQFVTAVLLFVCVFDVIRRHGPALFAAGIYLFAPIPFIGHQTVFFPDTLVQPLFVLVAYSFYRIYIKSPSKGWIMLFAVSLALATYTDWLGYAIAATSGVFVVVCRKRLEAWKILLAICMIAPVLSFTLTVTQYGYAVGYMEFLRTIFFKYTQSYGHESGTYLNIQKYLSVYAHYWAYVGLVKITALCALVHVATRNSFDDFKNERLAVLFFLFAAPVLVHHFVLLDWTAHPHHWFGTLKSVPTIALVTSYVVYLLFYRTKVNYLRWLQVGYVLFACSTMVLWTSYYYMHEPQTNTEDYMYDFCRIGIEMADGARDTVIFIKDSMLEPHVFPINPIFVYCAKRNMDIYYDRETAEDLMRKNSLTKGTVYTIAYLGALGAEIVKKETIELSADTD